CRLAEVRNDTTVLIYEQGCDSLFIQNFIYDPIAPTFIYENTCEATEVGYDTVYVSGMHCDSIYIVETSLIAGQSTILSDQTCDPAAIDPDTLYLSSLNGCDSLVITNYEFVPIEFEYELNVDPCGESTVGEVLFFNESGGDGNYNYSIDAVNFTSEGYFNGLSSSSYTLVAMDEQGCISESVEISIPVIPILDSNLGGVYEIESGGSIDFNIQFTSEPDTFYWSHPEILDCINCTSINVSPPSTTNLVLYMVSNEGCITQDEVLIQLKASSIYIPNIFSPDQDQVNDEFRIYNSGYVKAYKSFRIYNRWGNVVYEVTDVEGTEVITWNGSFNDELLNPDVFLYQLILETQSGKEEHWHGSITLIR
ncbi:MAG: T9SS type B sorting domain-containing protein, partial [Saprospiraceae bacterium]|nr:T9SS type B sorting domain-containing protein [Saprospiraceae bacterium]